MTKDDTGAGCFENKAATTNYRWVSECLSLVSFLSDCWTLIYDIDVLKFWVMSAMSGLPLAIASST